MVRISGYYSKAPGIKRADISITHKKISTLPHSHAIIEGLMIAVTIKSPYETGNL